MNDEQFIWESYQKILKENQQSVPWNNHFRLKVMLNKLSNEDLELYLDKLSDHLFKVYSDLEHRYPASSSGQTDPRTPDIKDLDKHVFNDLGFSYKELMEVTNRGLDESLVRDVLEYASKVAEKEINDVPDEYFPME